jgi:Ca2+-binding EF-hand superfamily protein
MGGNDVVDKTEYAASFDLVDADNDGRISAAELQQLMQVMGKEVTADQAAEMVRKVDSDGDGHISLEEFATFLSSGSP